jgi:homoserine O-acetyltransferase
MEELITSPQLIVFKEPLTLKSGFILEEYSLIVETYGTLNANASNAILICHALSGHHHAAGCDSSTGQLGWWDSAIGPGKAIDTNKFFVISLNNLGGCNGSTGPATINPKTGDFYGSTFPVVTVEDWVHTQKRLLEYFQIKQLFAVIGGSLGGMQALQWSLSYPNALKHCLVIAAAPKLSTENIAFNEVARQAILKDINFHDGFFKKLNTAPYQGLILARMLGHITYLSDGILNDKFARTLKADKLKYKSNEVEFQIESYLNYQGEKFSKQFDANTYILMTKALDYFHPALVNGGDLAITLQKVQAKFLIIAFSSDWRFSPKRSKEIVDALLTNKKDVSFLEFATKQGHDSFLLPIPEYLLSIKTYLNRNFENE